MKDCKEYIFQRLLNGPSNVLCKDKKKGGGRGQKTLCNAEEEVVAQILTKGKKK